MKHWIVASVLGLSCHAASAGTNGLDSTFGSGGVVLLTPTPTSHLTMSIYAIAVADDGKIIVGGRSADSTPQPAIGRLNSDGSWDTTFGDHGIFVLPVDASGNVPSGGEIRHVYALSNNGILASGGSYSNGSFQFSTCVLLMKLDSSGALNTAFTGDGVQCFNFGQPSSRNGNFEGIVVAASDWFYLTAPTTLSHGAVARFDSDGDLIPTFGTGGIAALPDTMFTDLLTVDNNGQLLAVGEYNGMSYTEIATVHLDASSGELDSSYGASGVFRADYQQLGYVNPVAVAVDSAGRLVIADNDLAHDTLELQPYQFYRVTPAGFADDSFDAGLAQSGQQGFAMPTVTGSGDEYVIDVRALPDGHLLAVGTTPGAAGQDGYDVALLRLDDDGGYDPSFGDVEHPGWTRFNIGQIGAANIPRGTALDTAGRLLLVAPAQDATTSCFAIVRILPDRLFADTTDSPPQPDTCPN